MLYYTCLIQCCTTTVYELKLHSIADDRGNMKFCSNLTIILYYGQVLPKHNEISADCETRYVRIVGTREAVFRVSRSIQCVVL